MKKSIITLLATMMPILTLLGQQMPSYNQFFTNRVLYNPSFIGQSGFTEVNINHRQQWAGIEGAPITTNVNFQAPLSEKFALGVVLFNDQVGLIDTYEATAGLSYNVAINANSKLTFGLTAGVGRNDIEFINDDPAYFNVLDNSLYFSGQFGMNFTMNKLTVGFALPQLMKSEFAQEKNFEEIGLQATNFTFSSVSYEFNLNHKVTLEPVIFYQSDSESISQLGAVAMFNYDDLFWIGGGYKQEQGANGFLGFNINDRINVGYAYEFAPAAIATELSHGSHEFQLGIKLGKTNKRSKNLIVEDQPYIESRTRASSNQENDEEVEEEEEEEIQVESEVLMPQKKTVQSQSYDRLTEETPILEEEVQDQLEVEEKSDEPEVREVRPGELAPGYYVVVGAYQNAQNADTYMRRVRASGYNVSKGYYPETGLNYIYIKQSDDYEAALKVRNDIKKIFEFEFRQAWILNVK